MKNYVSLILITILIFSINTLRVYSLSVSNFQQIIYPLRQCNDGIDNDSDGFVDFASDPECSSWIDDTEDLVDPLPPTPPPVIPPVSPPVSPPVTPQIPQPTPPFDSITPIIKDEKITQQINEEVQKIFTWEKLGEILGFRNIDSVQDSEVVRSTVITYIIFVSTTVASISSYVIFRFLRLRNL